MSDLDNGFVLIQYHLDDFKECVSFNRFYLTGLKKNSPCVISLPISMSVIVAFGSVT